MAKIVWTEPALTDLDAIGDYIALDNYEAARRLIQKVFERIDLLKQNPMIGRPPPELHKTPYRRISVNPIQIYYRVTKEQVIIIHLSRAERQFVLARITHR